MRVSVIIPVYNVEKYLKRCVDSVLRYLPDKTNYEICLIDDGSTDSSGTICDQLSEQYSCIRTMHKENGGLSSARNVGLKMADGDYIFFLDSDDFLLGNLFSAFIRCLECHPDMDIFQFGYEKVCKEDRSDRVFAEDDSFTVFNRESAYRDYLNGEQRITRMVTDKIIKRKLFDGIKFPVGYLAEDYGCSYLLLKRAELIVFDPLKYYGYFQREGSIMGTRSCKLIKDEYILGCKVYRETIDYEPFKNLKKDMISAYINLQIKTYSRLEDYRYETEVKPIRKAAVRECRRTLFYPARLRSKLMQILFLFLRPVCLIIMSRKDRREWYG